MNKKIIALAIAAAIAPAAAMADSGNVSIYGVAHVSYDNINTGTAGADTLNKVSSNSSRIGFKGTEDLGNGLSAIWQMEQGVAMDAGSVSSLTGRNTFLGLSSKTAGTFLMGSHDTPYKLATGGLDVFADTLGDYNTIIGNVQGTVTRDLRLGNVMAYISPTFSGFHAAVATSMMANGREASNGSLDNDKAWSLAGIYDNGPVFASLAWEKQTIGNAAGATAVTAVNGTYQCYTTATGANQNVVLAANPVAALALCTTPGTATVVQLAAPVAAVVAGAGATATHDTKGVKLGLGYNFGQGTKVGLVWEKLSDSAANSESSRKAVLLNVAHTMGANVIKASYGKASDGETAADTAAKNWTIGVDHMMSKRTSIYALYTKTDNAAGATYGVGNGGSGGAIVAAAGDDPRAISLGMKHSF